MVIRPSRFLVMIAVSSQIMLSSGFIVADPGLFGNNQRFHETTMRQNQQIGGGGCRSNSHNNNARRKRRLSLLFSPRSQHQHPQSPSQSYLQPPRLLLCGNAINRHGRFSGTSLQLSTDNNNSNNDDDNDDDDKAASIMTTNTNYNNFDGKGFVNYLIPYALALLGSILATAAMFKFVLLDY